MARVTVEDCLEKVRNRFALTVLAARRARALSEGRGTPLVDCENKEGVTALREVSSGYVRWSEDIDTAMRRFIEEQRSQLRSTSGEHTFLEAASLTGTEGEEESEEDVVEELPMDLERVVAAGAEEEAEEEAGETVVGEDGEIVDSETLPDEIFEGEPPELEGVEGVEELAVPGEEEETDDDEAGEGEEAAGKESGDD